MWALYLAWVFFKGPLLSKHARVVALLRARARPNSTLIIGCTVYTQLRAVQFLTTFFLVYFLGVQCSNLKVCVFIFAGTVSAYVNTVPVARVRQGCWPRVVGAAAALPRYLLKFFSILYTFYTKHYSFDASNSAPRSRGGRQPWARHVSPIALICPH